MSNSKYKMFLNYMHNELHITKEDIRQWLQAAVYESAKGYLKTINIYEIVEKVIRDKSKEFLGDSRFIEKRLLEGVVQELARTLEIKSK